MHETETGKFEKVAERAVERAAGRLHKVLQWVMVSMVSLLIAIGGWFSNKIFESIDKHESSLMNIYQKIAVIESEMKHNNSDSISLKEYLDKILTKLEHKIDQLDEKISRLKNP